MAAEEWDSGAYSQSEGIAWYGVAQDLFADTIITTTRGYDNLAWTSDKLDRCNTIVWGNYPTGGVIAVTILWYNRVTKAILEFDSVFDTDYAWDDARFHGAPWGPDAWETNEWNGMMVDGSQSVWHYKIIWVGPELEDSPYWREGGYPIWGEFEVIMDQGIDPSLGEGHLWYALATPNGFGGSQ